MQDGDTLDIDMNGTTDVPGDFLNNIAGKDVDVSFEQNIGGTEGSVKLTIRHNGAFPFKLTLTTKLDVVNAGYFANLYYLNEETGELEFVQAVTIGADLSRSSACSFSWSRDITAKRSALNLPMAVSSHKLDTIDLNSVILCACSGLRIVRKRCAAASYTLWYSGYSRPKYIANRPKALHCSSISTKYPLQCSAYVGTF